jgi:DNA polymerase-3 subunit delta'
MLAPKKSVMLQGHICITSEIETQIQTLQTQLHPLRVVVFFEETFKIEHAKAVTAEAYISENKTKYIIIAAQEFTAVAQNALLKLLEEPPRNIEFIIISPNKSNLLPTVRSRLPIVTNKKQSEVQTLSLSLARLDYSEVFEFLKQHARVSKNEAKSLVEALFYKAIVEERLVLSKAQLEGFDKAYRVLDLNARPQSVLATLLMSFAQERR